MLVLPLLLASTTPTYGSIVTGEVGAPVVVDQNNAIVTVEFLGGHAGYTGELFFRGVGIDPHLITTLAPDSDEIGRGFRLFNNHTSQVGSTIELPGLFNEGDVLHFGYELLAPKRVAGQGFYTDVADDHVQFMFNATTGFFGIEDLRLPWSDEDYNDAMFRVTAASIPGPGALACMSLLLGFQRRRRR
ncbi:MAG: DUF4114 domain-containing protein [Phycisphaerales bacterium]|nr:MAG: DUF4114 domain-containing protein [Phycisphaerales bacterium]